MNPGPVWVIDDDQGVLASLDAMLTVAGFEVVTFPSPDAFLNAVDDLKYGCIVTDVRMPGMSGLALIETLKRLDKTDWPLVVISGHADVPMAVAAMRAGASNFLEKPFDPPTLVRAVQDAFAAGRHGQETAELPDEVRARYETLSRREREVLPHLVNGASSKVAGLVLGISPRTVDVFRANILRKMQAQNIAALATVLARRPLD